MNLKNKKNYYVDKANGKKKIIIIVLAILVLLVSLIIFINMYYKNKNVGNNMSNKNIEEIEVPKLTNNMIHFLLKKKG